MPTPAATPADLAQHAQPAPDIAAIDWSQTQPHNQQFNDIYFSTVDGLAETNYVFIQHNQLLARWHRLPSHSHFTIIENGFGTGLNFLCAWQAFLAQAPADSHLHFVSTERYPLTRTDLQQALQLWPSLSLESAALLSQYQLPSRGFHRYHFAQDRIHLTLLVGDMNQLLPQLQAQADCWFLDGFAPAKNPDMWSPTLFQEMRRLSKPGATFATFTSAGEVKRGLQAAGFDVQKVPGYGRKRDMLCGYLPDQTSSDARTWRATCRPPQSVAIVGAGLAGCHAAAALARYGWSVSLFEQGQAVASAASGNPVGVLYARLSTQLKEQQLQLRALSKFILQGLEYSSRLLLGLAPANTTGTAATAPTSTPAGVLQLAFNDAELSRAQGILGAGLPTNLVQWVSAAQASELAGIEVRYPGLFYPQAGWTSPPYWCRALTQHTQIQTHLTTTAVELCVSAAGVAAGVTAGLAPSLIINGQSQWEVRCKLAETNGFGYRSRHDHLILANAHEANLLLGKQGLPVLPMQYLRGQITQFPALPASQPLRTVLCAEGYCAPASAGWHTCGATFDKSERDLSVRSADHLQNLMALAQLSPALSQSAAPYLGAGTSAPALQGRAAFRCATPDFKPIVGWLAQPNELPLGLTLAHGARGLITAPLSGESLVDSLLGLPHCLSQTMQESIDPMRFMQSKRRI
ncbi:FAD-dependent 5-carboxymethylaminomethyl-2-thiouridine(34) oxidoreductase MnmC [Parvibium lacunae]|uniref:tRNA 5-methylaminomethyl-2-thiouridine biosynthesis bifunctional protein MnmC n=1 Tax=Parvibium lacunae TaxID=1888893 RepID=A0A368L369_9BURK|nr:FAD-dependent 5-carboxymethylaminomethyl-2-thiouridine(34) oxidoreductase MnmC [Parvibium lacunae]RCS58027.1 FAD-dependent oxidoreductase [Parvibium lacunae]